MDENSLERSIEKIRSISFHKGSYGFLSDVPASVTLLYNDQDAVESMYLSQYLRKECKGVDLKARFKQSAVDKIDLLLMIDKDPAVIINAIGLPCRFPEKFKAFAEKQPKDKIVFLLFQINQRPNTIQNMAYIAEVGLETESHLPIQINSWDATPLETSP